MLSRVSRTLFRRQENSQNGLLLVAVLLAFISYLIYTSNIKEEPHESPAQHAFMKRVVGMARYTKGDPNKLTESDRAFIDHQTTGHTAEVLRNLYEFSKHTNEY